MSDDARQLIDNPYRASHTPIIAGDVNVTDLMARAWDRGFAAGDERLRSDFQSAASPDERLREENERLRTMLGKVPQEQLARIMAAADRDGSPDA